MQSKDMCQHHNIFLSTPLRVGRANIARKGAPHTFNYLCNSAYQRTMTRLVKSTGLRYGYGICGYGGPFYRQRKIEKK